MTMVSDKPCWEIMRCRGSECVARRHPEKPCWEHAEALNYTVCAHGVCRDCIVFVAKNTPPIFNEQQLSKILSHPKIYDRNQPKCPAQITRQRLWPISSEKRQTTRFRIRGTAKAVIINRESSIGQVLDLSHKGLSFSHNRQGAWTNQSILMNISSEDFSLSDLPAQIISDRLLPNSPEEQRRCSVRFNTLTLLQRDMLETIISQYGQAYHDGVFCC